jgi:mannan endo-1,4-beta-mannosidase
MVPMVELHDVTGSGSDADLLRMAQYYTQSDVSQVLQDFREYLLINIANEWSGTNYRTAYQNAINELRSSGINHTLVIDGNEYGQGFQAIADNWSSLLSSDPEGNLLFSVHMYGNYTSAGAVDNVLNQANSAGIPLIVGEFAPPAAWSQILSTCNTQRRGYIAWSWKGNEDSSLDLAQGWNGPLTSWGQNAMTSASGIANTSTRASIFQ